LSFPQQWFENFPELFHWVHCHCTVKRFHPLVVLKGQDFLKTYYLTITSTSIWKAIALKMDAVFSSEVSEHTFTVVGLIAQSV
jgi:hypothetical protein